MNTKGIKFLAVLAVLAMAFAVFAVVTDSETSDAGDGPVEVDTYDELKTAVGTDNFNIKLTADLPEKTATDVVCVEITKSGTIDLNGHNISFIDSRVLWIKSGEVSITGTGQIIANASVGGTFADSSSVIRVGSDLTTEAKLTIGENVTVSSNHCYGISVFGSGADQTLTVNGTVAVTGTACAISGNGTTTLKNAVITIGEKAVVTSANSNAIYFPCDGTLTINGKVDGKGGIEVKSGTTEIKGSSAIVASNTTSHAKNNDGCSTGGYAIALVENSGYKGAAAVTVSGGTINGDIVLTADNAVEAAKKGAITISGGTINGNVSIAVYKDGTTTITPQGTIVIPSTGTMTIADGKKLSIAAATTVTVEGTIVNNGTIDNKGTLSGEGSITGTGAINNYGTLFVAKNSSHNVLCTVNLYGGSAWQYADGAYYANSTTANDAVIKIGSSSTTKYVSAIQKNKSDGTIESATFDIFAPVELKVGDWLSGAEAQTVNVKDGASIDIDAVATTIYDKDVLNFEEGAKFLGTAAVTVKSGATINYADSSQYYTNTTIEQGGNVIVVGEGGSTPEKVEPISDDKIPGTTVDVNTFPTGVDVIIVSKEGLTDVTVPSGKAVVISAVPDATAVLDVSADDSEVTVNTGTTAATYAVKTGGSNSIYMKNVTGSLSFKKGSVEIDISKWTGGEIQIDDGADVKIVGSTEITANLSIVMKNAGKTATLTIEKDMEVTITTAGAFGLTIGEGIDFTVDGKLTAPKLTINDKLTVNGTVKATAFVVETTKAVDVFGTLEGAVSTTVTDGGKIVAYAASDINKATAADTAAYANFSGKTASGGTWTFDGTDKLTLTNYSGNYNFTQFKAALKTIVLEGANKVTYSKAITEATTFFGAAANDYLTIKTIQGTGSLEVAVNLSKTAGGDLSKGIVVFDGKDVKLDSVSLTINVSGSNSAWTETQTKAMAVEAICAHNSFTMKDSQAVIDVMSSYKTTGKTAVGIDSDGKPVTISDSMLSVSSAGAAIVGSKYTVTGSVIGLNGKLFGLYANNDAVEAISFSNSVVEISGKYAIVNADTGGISFSGCTAVAIKGTEYAMAKYADPIAAIAGNVEIRNTAASIEGELYVSGVEIASGAELKVAGKFNAAEIDLSQASVLEVKDLVIRAPTAAEESENNGTIIINGSATIIGSMTNKATMTNKGIMGIYGTFTNVAPGEFTNDGVLTVFKKELNFGANKVFELEADAHTDATKAKLSTITLDTTKTKLSINADGSISIKGAILTFDKDPVFDAKDLDKFDGTITPSQVDNSYTLVLTNGTATVTVVYTFDAAKGEKVGDDVIITVSGVLVDKTDSTKVLYLESNKSDKTLKVEKNQIKDMYDADSQAALILTSGKTVSTGVATIWSNYVNGAQAEAFNGKESVFQGDLISELAAITLGGTFEGDLYARGTGLTTIEGEMLGDVIAKGDVLISGTIIGDVKIALKAPLAAKFTVSGKMLGDLIYESSYKAASADTTDTVATAVMTVGADMTVATGETPISFEINLAAAANATTTTAGTPGFFTFGTLKAPAAGKNVVIILNQGMIKVPASVTIPERFQVVIEKDSTLEVVKGANMDVKKSALKVSKDAISHFETGSVAETYGLVACIMSFAIEDGAYMIYSDVAYALTACDEGAELTVTTSADIADNVAVKKGVNVIIADKVTLDFKTFGLAMDEGAKITLMGTGKVVFGQTGEDKTDDADWKFFTVSGTIVYDDDAIDLNEVRFDAAGAEFTGKAATSTEASKISVKLNYSEGTATLTAGNGTGTVALGNNSYPLEKGADDTLVCGVFVIAADTVFDATSITDAFSKVDYKKEAGDTVATIDKVVLMPTVVSVEGTLNLAASTTVKGVYVGQGVINLAAGKSFSLAISDKVPDAAAKDKTIPGSVAAKIVDTTDDQNGYVFNLVSPVPGETIAINAISMKIEGVTVDVMTISGNVEVGIITATTSAVVNGLTLQEKSALIGDEVYIVAPSKAIGAVYAKEIHMKEGAVTSEFSTLDYQVTTVDEDYTVYTYFGTIDFDEITDLYVATNVTVEEKLDLSGNDVNIVIAEGKALTIKSVLIIGTPITILGDDEGSSIVGKVIIDNTGGKAYYLVAYADVDLSLAEIVAKHTADGKPTDAVVSKLDVEDMPYATIFAEDNTVVLAKADATIVPEIKGYNFTAWLNYNGDAKAMVGETNAYADAKATYVTVMVKYVAGVDYYMNGSLFDALNVYTDVPYGSYFTAKISDTSKYQGNPLVNGEKTVYVIEDTELVASGVTPIPEPEPEPVIGDSGLSLTDILLIVLVVLIAIMVVILVLRLNRS